MSKQSPNFCALCIPALKMTRNKAPWDPLNVKSSPETPRFHDLSSCFLLRDCHLGYQNIPVLGHAQNIMSVWWWYILSYPIVLWFLLAYRPSIPNVFIDNQPWPSTNPQSSPRNSCASVVSANLPDPVQGTHHVPKMSVEVDWYKCKMQKNSLDKIFKMNLAVFIFICMWTWVCVRGRVGLLHFFCLPTLLYTLTSRSDEHPQSVWATNSMNDKYHQHLDKKTWNVPSPVLPETRSLETETRNGLSNRSLASIPPELISDVHPCSLARLEQFTNNFRKPWPTHSYIYIYVYEWYGMPYTFVGWWFSFIWWLQLFFFFHPTIQLGHVSWLRFRLEPATSVEAPATAWPPVMAAMAMATTMWRFMVKRHEVICVYTYAYNMHII